MEQEKRLDNLLDYLCSEYDEDIFIPKNYAQKRDMLRRLVNVRPPRPVPDDFISVQDPFLQEEAKQRGIVRLADILPCPYDSRISLWQGDITRLEVCAIVNAANSKMIGCFVPGHACIDNAIHTFAGVQLRQACYEQMREQECDEPTGMVKMTSAYNLPCRYVLHTVGPIVQGELTQKHCNELASCYYSCLKIAAKHRIDSIALCCISTGEFRFPNQQAAGIAVRTVREFMSQDTQIKRVIFNVFKDEDYLIYKGLLSANRYESQ